MANPWVFIHGTDIVNKGLIVLFFGLFCYFFGLFSVGPTGRGLIVLFSIFFAIFLAVFRWPPLETFLTTSLYMGVGSRRQGGVVLPGFLYMI